jgi:serine/threonine protein kinase
VGKHPSGQGNAVYIVDFGIAMWYRPKATPQSHDMFTGTSTWASLNALNGVEQSRRDDLESLVYTFIYMICGLLPWQQFPAKEGNTAEFVASLKEKTDTQFCLDLPEIFTDLLKEARTLLFNERPNYENYLEEFQEQLDNMSKEPVYSHYYQVHAGASTQNTGPPKAVSVLLPIKAVQDGYIAHRKTFALEKPVNTVTHSHSQVAVVDAPESVAPARKRPAEDEGEVRDPKRLRGN